MEMREICKNTYLFTDAEEEFFFNSTVILTEEGPIIIDVFRDYKQFVYIEKFLKDKGFSKPAAIIYTHWHTDHTCGNKTYTNCPVIAHIGTKEHLEDFINNDLNRLIEKGILEKDTKPILPTKVFEKEIELTIGTKKLKLIHCSGHTYDSILVYDEKSNILIAGDNLVGGEVFFSMPPVIPPDQKDACPKDLEVAFNIVEELKPQYIIPGHGQIVEPDYLLKLNRERYYKCLQENLSYTK